MLLGGRGLGKTRAGAEWIRSIACGEDTESPAEVGATSPRAAAGSRNASRSAQPKFVASAPIASAWSAGSGGNSTVPSPKRRPRAAVTGPKRAGAKPCSKPPPNILSGPDNVGGSWRRDRLSPSRRNRRQACRNRHRRSGDGSRDRARPVCEVALTDWWRRPSPAHFNFQVCRKVSNHWRRLLLPRSELRSAAVRCQQASASSALRCRVSRSDRRSVPFAGAYVDSVLFAPSGQTRAVDGPRLSDLRVTLQPKDRRSRKYTAARASAARSSGRPI
jgi:hypothetical protein